MAWQMTIAPGNCSWADPARRRPWTEDSLSYYIILHRYIYTEDGVLRTLVGKSPLLDRVTINLPSVLPSLSMTLGICLHSPPVCARDFNSMYFTLKGGTP